MQIRTHSNPLKRDPLDALVVPYWKRDTTVQAAVELPEHLELALAPPIMAGDFTATEGEVVWLWANEPEKRIALLGLGTEDGCSYEKLRRAFGALMRQVIAKKAKKISLFLPQFTHLQQDKAVNALCEGLYFPTYAFDAQKNHSLKNDPTIRPELVVLITPELHTVQTIADECQKVMEANFYARDLITSNADLVTPQYLANCATELMNEFGPITTTIYKKEWIEKEGMGLLMAVGKGSIHDPCFIQVKYAGNPSSSDHTIIVGKGVTFDTGGLNLKPEGSIENQRKDMSGAAIALATLRALAALEVSCNVTVLIPTCENAISGSSYKPGDVYRAYNGKTVEIANTDAEGRLILADALSYAVKNLSPSRIIDIATLTGAIVVALGTQVMGFFSNSDALADEIMQSGQRTFERVWRMPLYEEYKEALKSDIADIKNLGGREAGAVTAAIFLQEFVGSVPWIHLDIAGVAMYRENMRYWTKSATGIGVRLLVDYLQHLAKKE